MFFLFFLLTILLINIVYQWKLRYQLPKGPTPLPIIGNIHQIVYSFSKSRNVVDAFILLSKDYDKMITLWIFIIPIVFIFDYDLAHETHIKNSNIFSTRFSSGIVSYLRGSRGIIGSNGEMWQSHRRFALTTLRNFGFGRNLMETKIMDELDYRIKDFGKESKEDGIINVNSSNFFDLLVGSVINQLLTSKRFEKNDEHFHKLKKNMAKAMEITSLFDVFLPLSITTSFLFKWRHEYVLKPFDDILEFCVKNVTERVEQIKKGEHQIIDNGEDFIDSFLVKIDKDQKEGINSSFTNETLALDMFDLWLAGQETTSTTLTWGVICLLNHPEVQEKVHDEVYQVTKRNRHLSQSDRTSTPYLNATINEIQRIASILNINFFRKLDEDTIADGQRMKAGTIFTTQLAMIHSDEKLFENHEKFDPERFMKNDGLDKKLIPFGIGKRSCLGESLARAELYLILGNLLLNYKFQPVDSVPKIEAINPFGFLKRPPVYDFKLVPI